jgi:nicotinate-nucleotide adenylyltransferase
VPTLRYKRIGILGGSFNPVHEGHVHISELALDTLGLDEVWWLVSPQNPLKPVEGMAQFEDRLQQAKSMTSADPQIVISDFEKVYGSRRTLTTLRKLKQTHPAHQFVWLMGADNLIQAHRWNQWAAIFKIVPIAIFARPTYSLRALSACAAKVFASARVKERAADTLADLTPPAWVYLEIPLHPASSTEIRSSVKIEGPGAENVKSI